MTKPRTRNPSATRQRLLDAARDIACEEGASSLSLDAVAARAGVSKGGLLYHFPSREALLRAVVTDSVDRMRDDLEARAPGALAGSAPALPAACCYLDVLRDKVCTPSAGASGFFAAMLEDPAFMEPVLTFRSELRALFARCPDPRRGAIVFMACEGLVHEKLTAPFRTTEGNHALLLDLAALLTGESLSDERPSGEAPAG